MKWFVLLCSAGLWLGLAANFIPAAEEEGGWHPNKPLPLLRSKPDCNPAPIQPGCPTPSMPTTPPTTTPTTPPTTPDQTAPVQPQTQDAFSQSPEAGSLAADTADSHEPDLQLAMAHEHALSDSVPGRPGAFLAPVPVPGSC